MSAVGFRAGFDLRGSQMKHILPMPTEGGGIISVEVDDDEPARPVMRGAGSSAFLDKSAQSLSIGVEC